MSKEAAAAVVKNIKMETVEAREGEESPRLRIKNQMIP